MLSPGFFITQSYAVSCRLRKRLEILLIFVDSGRQLNENTQLRSRGGVPEWLKGSDCKSDGSAFGGSNPPPSTILSGQIRVARDEVGCKYGCMNRVVSQARN